MTSLKRDAYIGLMARYDGLANWYDSEFLGQLHEQTLRAAVQLLGPTDGRLLDLGCGTGAQTAPRVATDPMRLG